MTAPQPSAPRKHAVAQILQRARAQRAAHKARATAANGAQRNNPPPPPCVVGVQAGVSPNISASTGTVGRSVVQHRSKRQPLKIQPVKSRPSGFDESPLTTDTGTAVAIGPATIELIKLAYASSIPVMLIGPHGIGKSEVVHAAAKSLGIDFISRDLTLLEPPDLCGLPKIENGVTTYFPPEFLPRDPDNCGLFLMEELNRAPRYVTACALELLTSRRLHSFQFPRGVLPMACINPKTDGYHVDVLDAALMSRFMKIEVCASVESWVAWARENGIHPTIIHYVESVPNALDESKGGVNPRSWTYASRTLVAAGPELLERSPDTIVTALNGLIGSVHTTALLRMVFGTEVALTPADVIQNPQATKATVRRWIQQGRLDLIAVSMRALLQWLRPEGVAEQLRSNPREQAAVKSFLALMPGDFADQSCGCLLELGYTHLIPTTTAVATMRSVT